jgi:glycosyltransferase involved in cell wall biosynthesis
MPQLRVAIVTETYLPQINGVSKTLSRLVDYLAAQGDEVKILAPRYDTNPSLPEGAEVFPFRAVPLPFYKEVVIPVGRPGRIWKILKSQRPDLVHVATEGPFGLSAIISARCLGIPVVSSFHTNFPQYIRLYGTGWLEGTAWRYLRWFHNATLTTFCPTFTIENVLLSKGFRSLAIWGRGVDSHLFDPRKRNDELRRSYGIGPEEIVLSYVGRLAVEKNLGLLMDAWRQLPKDRPFRLMLTGDGPLFEKLRSEFQGQEKPKVLFTGYKQGEELARHYASADLFIFPSVTETFGNVILEAMSSGLPVVSFRVQGPQDIVQNGRSGLFAPEISSGDLASTILDITDQPQKMRAMGKQARAYAESQTWPHILKKVRSRYLDVLSRFIPTRGISGCSKSVEKRTHDF